MSPDRGKVDGYNRCTLTLRETAEVVEQGRRRAAAWYDDKGCHVWFLMLMKVHAVLKASGEILASALSGADFADGDGQGVRKSSIGIESEKKLGGGKLACRTGFSGLHNNLEHVEFTE